MSTPDEDEEAVITAAEKIARMAMGDVNMEEYRELLFNVAATLAGWRGAMVSAGYSEYLIEKSAWMILTSFYGHHLTETRIEFEPPEPRPTIVSNWGQS